MCTDGSDPPPAAAGSDAPVPSSESSHSTPTPLSLPGGIFTGVGIGSRSVFTRSSSHDDESAFLVASTADALTLSSERRERVRTRASGRHRSRTVSDKFTSTGKVKRKPDRSLSELEWTVDGFKKFFDSRSVRRKVYVLACLFAWYCAIVRFLSDGDAFGIALSQSTPEGFTDEVTPFERITIVIPASHAALYRSSAARGGMSGTFETAKEVEARRREDRKRSAGHLPYLQQSNGGGGGDGPSGKPRNAMPIEGTNGGSAAASPPPPPEPPGLDARDAPPLEEDEGPSLRPLKVLAMGGSTTWGSKLNDRTAAYPTVLADKLLPRGSVAVNAAVRATGADYAGMCVQTMIREAEEAAIGGTKRKKKKGKRLKDRSDRREKEGEYEEMEYDVIIFEFSLNGLDGFELLANRLRCRYPSAIFVYVHLWSLRSAVQDARTKELPNKVLHTPGINHRNAEKEMSAVLADKSRTWEWADGQLELMERTKDTIETTAEDAGALFYELPVDLDGPAAAFREEWFGEDFHHLGAPGHKLVADGVKALLDDMWKAEREAGLRHAPIRGTWGGVHTDGGQAPKHLPHGFPSSAAAALALLPDSPQNLLNRAGFEAGDHCLSWYTTGKTPHTVHRPSGRVKRFVKPDKYAHHVQLKSGPAEIEFRNPYGTEMPLGLNIMVWGEVRDDGDSGGGSSVTSGTVGRAVYPRCHVTAVPLPSPGSDVPALSPPAAEEPFLLKPVHPNPHMRVWHVTQTIFVGAAHPGWNIVRIEPIEETERPLRIVGLVMCAACGNLTAGWEDGSAEGAGGTLES